VIVPSTVDVSTVDVDAAEAAYIGLISTSDKALADPHSDWSTQIRHFAVDPAASTVLADVALVASDDVRMVGHSKVIATVVKATASRVAINACVDTSGKDILDAEGNSVKAGDTAKSRHRQAATVIKTGGGIWAVQDIATDPSSKC
jgi:hypothetical protein